MKATYFQGKKREFFSADDTLKYEKRIRKYKKKTNGSICKIHLLRLL